MDTPCEDNETSLAWTSDLEAQPAGPEEVAKNTRASLLSVLHPLLYGMMIYNGGNTLTANGDSFHLNTSLVGAGVCAAALTINHVYDRLKKRNSC